MAWKREPFENHLGVKELIRSSRLDAAQQFQDRSIRIDLDSSRPAPRRVGRTKRGEREKPGLRWAWPMLLIMALAGGVAFAFVAVESVPVFPAASIVDKDKSREVIARTFAVVEVWDGDTFKIVYDGELTRVRLAQVDAPELDEPGGPESKAALIELIGGKSVTIDFTDPKGKRDHYGRLLCSLFVNGLDVEAELVRQGHATPR